MTVLADENQPPVPLTQHSLAFSTWRPVGLAAQLPDGLHEQEHAAHAGVAVREAAAVGVGGQRAAEAHAAVGDERAAFALLAEAEPLERLQHHRRERVVDLADVDLFGRHARPLERERAAARRGRLGEVFPLAHRRVRRRLAGAEHPHRLLRRGRGRAPRW